MSAEPDGGLRRQKHHRRAARRDYLALAAIAAIAALLTLHGLDAADVCGDNEAIEGVFVQQMVEHGAILFPLLNGREPMYKPPLFHWTAAAIAKALGVARVTAFTLRLPSALYATAGVILTMAFALRTIGPPGAIIAGLVLDGSYQYVTQGRVGRVDMTLAFFETMALLAFLCWYLGENAPRPAEHREARDDTMLYGVALALGLAVLAKGPVGAGLPLIAIGMFLIVTRQPAVALKMLRPGPVLVAVAVGSSWYGACLISGRHAFLSRQLGSENLGRFVGSLGAMPPWYYVEPILLNSIPLSLLVPIAVAAALAQIDWPKAGRAEHNSARAAVGLLAIFWVVTVVFFSIASYKRRAYLLPLWPSSALMLAWWIEDFRSLRLARTVRLTVGAICAGLIAFNFIYLPGREIRNCGGDSYRQPAEAISRVVGPEEPLYIYGIQGSLAPLLFYLDRRVTPLSGKLSDAPPGYIILPGDVWAAHRNEAPELEPVLTSSYGRHVLILLRHGKVYAASDERAEGSPATLAVLAVPPVTVRGVKLDRELRSALPRVGRFREIALLLAM